MRKIFTLLAASCLALTAAHAQDAQKAAAEAAAALTAAQDVPAAAPKPTFWNKTLLTNINFTQTSLTNWVAGGYNNYTLAGYIDANENYKKDKMIWNNRLQLDYGFLYSQDKPIIQKNKDRIYLESKWGYETPIRHLSYSASFDFKTQFDDNWNYGTPKEFTGDEPTRDDWLNARKLKSGLFSPAYINLGLGVLWTPNNWLSVNFSPINAGFVIVQNESLRKTYGMELLDAYKDTPAADIRDSYYRSSRFELGAQLKADAKFQINDNINYTTQLVLFSNYLHNPLNLRVNWDNKFFWKLAKFFALTFSTNLIYDDTILAKDITGDGKNDVQAIQFKEFLELGFSYTFASKK